MTSVTPRIFVFLICYTEFRNKKKEVPVLNKEENTRLLLYTRFYSDPVFAEMIRIAEDKYESLAARSDALYSCASQLIAWAEEYGFLRQSARTLYFLVAG
jgi:hypothetical protein